VYFANQLAKLLIQNKNRIKSKRKEKSLPPAGEEEKQ